MADRMGLYDETLETGQIKPGTKEGYLELVNNQRRFVKGILKLPLDQQELRIKTIQERILMAEASHKAKLEEEVKAKAQEQAMQTLADEAKKE